MYDDECVLQGRRIEIERVCGLAIDKCLRTNNRNRKPDMVLPEIIPLEISHQAPPAPVHAPIARDPCPSMFPNCPILVWTWLFITTPCRSCPRLLTVPTRPASRP